MTTNVYAKPELKLQVHTDHIIYRERLTGTYTHYSLSAKIAFKRTREER